MWQKDEVAKQLKEKQVKSGQSLRAFASTLNCSPAYISRVINGKQEPGPLILEELGLEKIRTIEHHYKPKKKWRKDG